MTSTVPVVLLHGALRGRMGLLPSAWSLRRHGLSPRTFGYAARRRTLDEHADALAAMLDTWLEGERREVLGFFTHSMGGLVVRAYLQRSGDRHAAQQRIVMLSPPNRGSELARQNADNPAFRWLYGQAAAELQPEAVQRLAPLPSTAEVLVLAGGRGDPRGYNPRLSGDDDGVVAVDEMGLPDSEPVHVGGIHGLLQWRPEVLRRAAGFLRGESLTAPRAPRSG